MRVFLLSGCEFVATGFIVMRRDVCVSNPLLPLRVVGIDLYLSITVWREGNSNET